MKNAAAVLALLSAVALAGCASTESPEDDVAAASSKKIDPMSNSEIRTGSRIPSGNSGQAVATTSGKSYLESLDNKSVQTSLK
jgi:outer membrane lipoprotein SlyB